MRRHNAAIIFLAVLLGLATPVHAALPVLFVDRCAGDCNYTPGADDSRTNLSSLVSGANALSAFAHGDTSFAEVLGCLRDTFAPFAIDVTDVDPGSADHFEVAVAGNAQQFALPTGVTNVSPGSCLSAVARDAAGTGRGCSTSRRRRRTRLPRAASSRADRESSRTPPEANHLTWAIIGSEGRQTINRMTKLLGRKGIMTVTLVAAPEEIATAPVRADQLLGAYRFRSGHTYAEYLPGKDSVAEMGLEGLIPGGAGAARIKSGLGGIANHADLIGPRAAPRHLRAALPLGGPALRDPGRCAPDDWRCSRRLCRFAPGAPVSRATSLCLASGPEFWARWRGARSVSTSWPARKHDARCCASAVVRSRRPLRRSTRKRARHDSLHWQARRPRSASTRSVVGSARPVKRRRTHRQLRASARTGPRSRAAFARWRPTRESPSTKSSP